MLAEEKIVTREALVETLEQARQQGRKVAFTSGVFDLLHAGHVEYLQQARQGSDLLVVALNSNSSVAALKGAGRPVNDQQDRALVVASLASVDYVFIFDDPNNNETVRLLKPDTYVKAGDYKKSQLSSAPIVESYGGQIRIVPVREGLSTTATIEKVVRHFGIPEGFAPELGPYKKAPAVFLDRDGTINQHVEFLHEPEKLQLLPGVAEGIVRLRDAGYRIVVTTNQAGIGMGYFSKEDFFKVNKEMLRQLSKAGALVDRIYFSPHSKAENSNFRKPKIGMIERAVEELNVEVPNSFVIGDMTTDVLFGKNAGCGTILVQTGQAGQDGIHQVTPDFVADNFLSAVEFILESGLAS